MLHTAILKAEFPLFHQPQWRQLVYLDNAATAQKPTVVIEAINQYYTQHNANVGRGVYDLSTQSTQLFAEARHEIASFFGASSNELILTRNATEAINALVWGWAQWHIKTQEVVLVTQLEHHSNLVPWQELCRRQQATLREVRVSAQGELDWEDLIKQLRTHKPRLLAITHLSNVTGTVCDPIKIKQLVKKHSPQTKILLDAAQSAGKLPIYFDRWGVDFLVFSGHKMYGPMGIGGLFVTHQLIKSSQFVPWLFGGGMIDKVEQTQATFSNSSASRFSAGTPDVASAVGLAAACRWLNQIGVDQLLAHDQILVQEAYQLLSKLDQYVIIGPEPNDQFLTRVGSIALYHKKLQAHDLAQVLNNQMIAVRSGWHCCEPLHRVLNWPNTLRISFALYNNAEEIRQTVDLLSKAEHWLKAV